MSGIKSENGTDGSPDGTMSVVACEHTPIWKTTEPGDMNPFGVTDRYLEFNYRGPDWDQNSILI